MDEKQKLQLQNMIKANNVEDQTEFIRELKHSEILRNDVNKLIEIKKKYTNTDTDATNLYNEGAVECSFLFTYYTDIFNKIRKDEIDITILFSFLDILKKIEDGELDQHEGSFMVGELLKKIYIDSALKKAEKLNETKEPVIEPKKATVAISWSQFRSKNI
jgi:predicted transcriptional regulator